MRKLSLLLLVPAILCVGCASKESKLLGKWVPEDPKGAGSTLELKADHKFEQGGMLPAAGTWALKDTAVELKVETLNGQSVAEVIKKIPAAMAGQVKDQLAKPISATLSDDLKTMTISVGGTQQKLKKSE